MQELIQTMGSAVLRRNPLLIEKLQPGLSDRRIRTELKRSGIEGAIEPIVELYSWRNGTILDMDLKSSNTGFLPHSGYQFTELKRAVADMKGFKELARYHPRLSVLVGRYFPFLWDGSISWIALDIESSAHRRVVRILTHGADPLFEAYDSFEDFLSDAIRANENDQLLACLKSPGMPIREISRGLSGKADGVAKSQPKENEIPLTENTLVLRTDFSDEAAWESLCKSLQDGGEEFGLSLDFVSDRAYADVAAGKLPDLLPEDFPLGYAFIADRSALTSPDHPILVVDLHVQRGRTFRVAASAFAEVECNLSIGNMGFEEFANAVDKDGIFRGFSGS